MGNFYTNITLHSTAEDQVTELLRAWGERAYVSPVIGRFLVVFPASTENQDTELLQSLAARLSAGADCAALAVLNHDDDVLAFWLFIDGRLTDAYDSTPGYFGDFDPDDLEDESEDGEEDALDDPTGGDAIALCAAFGAPEDAVSEVELVLRAYQSWDGDLGYLFAVDRHADLVGPLGLPNWAVGFGYNYLAAGELPEDLDADTLTHIDGE